MITRCSFAMHFHSSPGLGASLPMVGRVSSTNKTGPAVTPGLVGPDWEINLQGRRQEML
jgi:hypothetical protein